jgi:predicted DNA-binding transcriptional regulator AlpA
VNNPAITGGKERMLNTREAAEFLGLSASTLNKMRITGAGPAYITLGLRRVVYHPADLKAWLDANRRRSTSDRGGSAK